MSVPAQPLGIIAALSDFAVAQLTTDGQLDNAGFGGGSGKFIFSFGATDIANDVAIQPDGNIVMVGFSDVNDPGVSNDFAIARVLADGSNLDNTFGATANGLVTINFTNDDKANAVALRPDGRIGAVGSWDGGNSDYAIAQLTTGGQPDNTFGGGFFPAGSGNIRKPPLR